MTLNRTGPEKVKRRFFFRNWSGLINTVAARKPTWLDPRASLAIVNTFLEIVLALASVNK
jgi:hypothetical protein